MIDRPYRLTQAQRSGRTRERLVMAAIDALYRYGYSAVSTTLVAELAGVSRGAMLHQFATKAQLMAEVVDTTHQRNVAAYRAALSRNPLTAEERLLALLDSGWMRHASADGVAQDEIRAATRSDPELAECVRPVLMRHVEEIQETFGRLMTAAGITDRAVSDALLTVTIATLRGLALEKALGREEAQVEAAFQQLRRTLEAEIRDRLPRPEEHQVVYV
ncbi:MAG: TetR/AcrR family transcriptional regulator [Phenylobacterium sp.]|jgi:AcrR family transcriptional regulator|nr:TetR/AcrR family transcriptional regulator [Phenylobacterium sp.]